MNYQPGYWESSTIFNDIDVCVLGSGIVGLNAAIHLKASAPGLKVMVVERGFLPYGASTRNAGFACFGSMTELLDDLEKETEDEVFRRVELRWKGLTKLRSLLGDAALEYEPLGGFEVFTNQDKDIFKNCCEKLESFNKQLKNITGEAETYAVADNQINSFGFSGVDHLIINRGEGQLNTGKMMQALASVAQQNGVIFINGLSVNAVESVNNLAVLTCDNGLTIRAKRLLVANNGFAKQLFPSLPVVPARAQVLITKPIGNLKIKGSFHYEKGYYYFRNVQNRILFGGGRNLDFSGETTTEFGTTSTIQNKLEELLHTMILPNQKVEIDMRWSGIMGLGPSKSPVIQQLNENVFCAVRMGGMGVAIGSLVGETGAEMVLKTL